MGIRGGSSRCDCPPNVNPDPHRFVVKTCAAYRTCFVSTVHYPNCTNFEGNKVMVTEFDPRTQKVLDPHFRSGAGIIARFEPSAKGKALAHSLAEMLDNNA